MVPSRHLHSNKARHRPHADSRRKREAAETFRGAPPPGRLLSRLARQPSLRGSKHSKGRPSVSSRHQGRKARTKERKARDSRRNQEPSLRGSNNSKGRPNVSSGHQGRRARTKDRKARHPRRNQSRATRRAVSKVSSKVGNATNDATVPMCASAQTRFGVTRYDVYVAAWRRFVSYPLLRISVCARDVVTINNKRSKS